MLKTYFLSEDDCFLLQKEISSIFFAQAPLEHFVHLNPLRFMDHLNFYEANAKCHLIHQIDGIQPLQQLLTKLFKLSNYQDLLEQEIKKTLQYKYMQEEIPSAEIFLQKAESLKNVDSNYEINLESSFRTINNWYGQIHGINPFDQEILPLLQNFFSNYFDRGLSLLGMEKRELGIFNCFKYYYEIEMPLDLDWHSELAHQLRKNQNSIDVINQFYSQFGFPSKAALQSYLFNISLNFKGLIALINSLTQNPKFHSGYEQNINLLDFWAVIIICKMSKYQNLSNQHGIKWDGEYFFKHLFQYQSILTEDKKLPQFVTQDWLSSTADTSSHNDHDRKKYFQKILISEVIQRVLEKSVVTDFANNIFWKKELLNSADISKNTTPPFTAYFCLDDREESLRRYLEKDDQFKTFGVAGHFNLDLSFQTLGREKKVKHCPPIVFSKLLVKENEIHHPILKYSSFIFFQIRGGILSYFLLPLTSIYALLKMVLYIFFPLMGRHLGKKILADHLEPTNRDFSVHYMDYSQNYLPIETNYKEMADRIFAMLNIVGNTQNLSPITYIVGHGSNHLSNPHQTAYQCAACNGNSGLKNSRIFCWAINHPAIRLELIKLGVNITEDHYFISAFHDTCANEITYYGVEHLPEQIKSEHHKAAKYFEEALNLDAKERSRRFSDLQDDKNDEKYLRKHFLKRSFSVYQTRPEYGHNTNNLCIIGGRHLTKNLFLDKRAFLISYDFKNDQGKNLNGVLNAGGIVSANINLDYYFSSVDNSNLGANTKIGHNLKGLVGVINGSSGDLLMGLPKQMIEIHEPLRLNMIVECSQLVMREILTVDTPFSKYVKNEWINLYVLENEKDLHEYYQGQFFQLGVEKNPNIQQFIKTNDSYYNSSMENLAFKIINNEPEKYINQWKEKKTS